jgi:glycerol-3-phosphate dehydrogenase
MPPVDLLVVGGGVNGTGIARDAAGRGLSVLLCEQDDLAAHTSSSSTKLIHGGLRYLEFYHFGLVRKALQEREVLLAAAPHIMWPLRFVLPHDRHQRPAWMIRAGLFLYDHLAHRRLLPGSAAIDLTRHPAGAALKPGYTRAFAYSDGWVDDARLVVLNALDARERGAQVMTRTRCTSIERSGELWQATLAGRDGSSATVSARSVVNAAGPWAGLFAQHVSHSDSRHAVRLVKGSHIVVPRLFDHDDAYFFQNPDRRIIFAIPYEESFTLIGTTDVDYDGDPASVSIEAGEIEYLCQMAGRYLARPVRPADVVWSYSGVRPLLDDESHDASNVTRDYTLEMDDDGAPLLHVLGGKITTFRKLAEEVVDRMALRLGCRAQSWTAGVPLPGGDLPGGDAARYAAGLVAAHPWLPAPLARRYTRCYGTRAARILDGAGRLEDLGAEVLPGLHEREIEYLCREEWARSAEDILWRRTKLGLHVPRGGDRILDAWLAGHSRS